MYPKNTGVLKNRDTRNYYKSHLKLTRICIYGKAYIKNKYLKKFFLRKYKFNNKLPLTEFVVTRKYFKAIVNQEPRQHTKQIGIIKITLSYLLI